MSARAKMQMCAKRKVAAALVAVPALMFAFCFANSKPAFAGFPSDGARSRFGFTLGWLDAVLRTTDEDGRQIIRGLCNVDFGPVGTEGGVVFTGDLRGLSTGMSSIHLGWNDDSLVLINVAGSVFLAPIDLKNYDSLEDSGFYRLIDSDDLKRSDEPDYEKLQSIRPGLNWVEIRLKKKSSSEESVFYASDMQHWISREDLDARVLEVRESPSKARTKDLLELPRPAISYVDFRNSLAPSTPSSSDRSRMLFWGAIRREDSSFDFDSFDLQLRPEGPVYAKINRTPRAGLRTVKSVNTLLLQPYFYQFVYSGYSRVTGRKHFNSDFIAKLKEDDAQMPLERMMFLANFDSEGRTVAMVRLFDGSFSSNDESALLPIERKYPGIKLSARSDAKKRIYEFNRLYVDSVSAPWMRMKRILKVFLHYLKSQKTLDGTFYLHTDLEGVERYRWAFGAKIEYGPEVTGDDTYILSVEGRQFLKSVQSAEIAGYPDISTESDGDLSIFQDCSRWLKAPQSRAGE